MSGDFTATLAASLEGATRRARALEFEVKTLRNFQRQTLGERGEHARWPAAFVEEIERIAALHGSVVLRGGNAASRLGAAFELHARGGSAAEAFIALAGPASDPEGAVQASSGGTLFVESGDAPFAETWAGLSGPVAALPSEVRPRLMFGLPDGSDVSGAQGPVSPPAGPAFARPVHVLALPAADGDGPGAGDAGLREMMDEFEKRVIRRTLADQGGNRTWAARKLGITREGLHKKLLKHGLG